MHLLTSSPLLKSHQMEPMVGVYIYPQPLQKDEDAPQHQCKILLHEISLRCIDVSDQKNPFCFCNNVEYLWYNNQINPTLTPYSLHCDVFLIHPSTDAVAINSVNMHLG